MRKEERRYSCLLLCLIVNEQADAVIIVGGIDPLYIRKEESWRTRVQTSAGLLRTLFVGMKPGSGTRDRLII